MKIKYLVITAVFAIAVLGFGLGAVANDGGAVNIQAQIAQLQAQIQSLMQQIAVLQAQQGTTQPWCHTFNTNLKIGDGGMAGGGRSPNVIDNDVAALKQALAKEGLYDLNIDQPGTAGTSIKQTSFNEQLASSVVQFQEKYASEILTPNGLSHGTGYVGASTRAKLNKLYGCGNSPTCSNLYWFDNTSSNPCQTQKQFCGAFMYYGLQTFNSQQACLNAFYLARGNCTPNWTCGWGQCVNGYQSQTAVDSNNCGLSDSFDSANIYCPELARICAPSTNLTPVISGVSGPATLNVGQTGTWTVNASDPENGTLSYSIIWGDEPAYPTMSSNGVGSGNYTQTTTFTHSYAGPGVYTPIFYVKDNFGNTAKTSISVNVGSIVQQCTIDSDCPTACPLCGAVGTTEARPTCGGPCITSKCVSGRCAYNTSSITIISPNGGETFIRTNGQVSIPVKWITSNVPSTFSLDVIRLRGYDNGVEYNLNNYLAGGYLINDGNETIQIPMYANIPDGAYTLEIKSGYNGTTLFDKSDSYFKIATASCPAIYCFTDNCPGRHLPDANGCVNCSTPCPSTQPSITVTSPNGGETWKTGETHNIIWTTTGLSSSDTVNIMLLSYDQNGNPSGEMLNGTINTPNNAFTSANSGFYTWTIPSTITAGNNYKIEVNDNNAFSTVNNIAIHGLSANYFSIVGQ